MNKNISFVRHLFAAFLLSAVSLFAQQFTYTNNLYPNGLSVLRSDAAGMSYTWSTHNFEMSDIQIEGTIKKAVHLNGVFLPNEAGFPDLPTWSRFIAIPRDASAEVIVESFTTEKMTGIEVAPAPMIPKETDKPELVYPVNSEVFSKNALYPASPVQLLGQTQLRGVDAVSLCITPFQYNPVSKELIIYKDIKFRVEYRGGSGQFGEARLRSRWWDPVLQAQLLNYEALPVMDYSKPVKSLTPDFEYIIICPDNPVFLPWADTLKNWRNKQGVKTGVVTLSQIGGNDSVMIRNYIKTAYNTWAVPPVAVLFIGDFSTAGPTGNGVISPKYNNYCTSDNIYVDINMNHLPELASGRIVASTAQHLQTIIGKMMSYERTPPTLPSFYQKPVIAGGWQTERWFILCDEIIFGYLKNKQGKTPVREYAIYSGTPGSAWSTNQNTNMVVNYFGPNGTQYIPAGPQHLTDWGGNATRINADLNAGSFILQHRDHGMETGWGEPSYTNTAVNQLNNALLPYVFSMNCLTGKYTYSSDCFAEAFHRHAKGALGLIAATEVSYSFVNDAFAWGLYDFMFPDFDPGRGSAGPMNLLPAFGMASGKIYLQASSFPYNTSNKAVTHHLFHHWGDTFMRLFSEVPQTLAVQHDTSIFLGTTTLSVNAPEGSLVCLSKNNQIIATALGAGMPMCVPVGDVQLRDVLEVTVTKQNYYRYCAKVTVYADNAPVRVIRPNGGEVLQTGTIRNIDWTSNGVANVSIEYSTNNGTSWTVINGSVSAVLGTFNWTVPNTPSAQCKIRICDCSNPATNDLSDNVFSITATNPLVTWESGINVKDNAGQNGTLLMGTGRLATNGVDPLFGEISLPPAPPAGVFDTRFELPVTPADYSQKDYRCDTLKNAAWKIVFQPGPGGYPVTVRWDKLSFPLGSFFLKDNVTGTIINVNMKMNDSVVVTSAGINSLSIVYSKNICMNVPLATGWNIVSAPVAAEDMTVATLFPGANSAAYMFNNGYQSATSITPGKGYWIRYPQQSMTSLCGQLPGNTVPLLAGWNLMGVYNADVPVNQIISDPPGIINSQFYGYDNGYIVPAVLLSGKGYWVRATQNGNLIVPVPVASKSAVSPVPDISFRAKITVRDNDENAATLYLTDGEAQDYLSALPPQPPQGIFDARFASQFNSACIAASNEILISGAAYPVRISVTGTNLRVKDKATGGKIFDQILRQGEEMTVLNPGVSVIEVCGAENPAAYELMQNYPNPFNPATTISFSVPERTRAVIGIYNQLGEKVALLGDKEYTPGYHSVEWNASGFPSGIYFYELKTQTFSSIKKLVVLK